MNIKTIFSSVQMNWLAVLAGVLFLSLAGGVSAAEKDRPCVADAKKLCAGVEKGEGRTAKCLKEHEDEVSPACKDNIKKMKKRIKKFSEACKADAATHCEGTKPGEGRIMMCLKQHEGELSSACKSQIDKMKRKRK